MVDKKVVATGLGEQATDSGTERSAVPRQLRSEAIRRSIPGVATSVSWCFISVRRSHAYPDLPYQDSPTIGVDTQCIAGIDCYLLTAEVVGVGACHGTFDQGCDLRFPTKINQCQDFILTVISRETEDFIGFIGPDADHFSTHCAVP